MRFKTVEAVFGCAAFLLIAPQAVLHARTNPSQLRTILEKTRWIAYAPTHYFPAASPPVLPSDAELEADLGVLRDVGFDGLITYGSDVEKIPAIAYKVGFRRMLVGIWDPWNPRERTNALRSVQKYSKLIAGVIVGNEGLSAGRYNVESLCKAMAEIGKITGKPISTTEPFDWILSEPRLAGCSAFLTVNAHPYFSNRKRPEDAVQWTFDAWNSLRSAYPSKPLLLKEVGLPTAGDEGLSEANQREYYLRLAQTHVVFAYFEAFDATPRFKAGVVEQSWGLWKADRTPKDIIDALPWRTNGQHLQ